MPIIADTSATTGPTLDQLVNEITSAAQGHAITPDKVLYLSGAITDTDLSLTLAGGTASPGVFEVGDELILVTLVDSATGVATVHPRGRGWMGSTAVAHADGDLVTESPALPRARIQSSINDVILSLFPALYATDEVYATTTGTILEVPATAEFILDVRVQQSDEWVRVHSWEQEMRSETSTTGRGLWLPTVSLGSYVQVIYATRPEPFADTTQTWSDTGLAAGVKDVVVLGVLARFAQVLDIGRLTDRMTTPRGDNQQPQLGTGFAMARQLRADFQAALDREANALRKLYPARAHYTR